jgi:hypothetical protein
MDRVYLKEGRERIEKGARWKEKKEGQGAFGKTAISFLFLDLEQGREAGRPRPTAAAAAPRGSAAAGDRGKRRGGRGLPIPALTLVGDDLWRWLRGEEWAAAEVSGGSANGGGGGAREGCGGSMVR